MTATAAAASSGRSRGSRAAGAPRSPREANAAVLHETAQRLRLALRADDDADAVQAKLVVLPGVSSVRVNNTLRCVVVVHDGQPATRAAVLGCLSRAAVKPSATARRGRERRTPTPRASRSWAPAALAAAVPVLPQSWRGGAALAVIATRIASQPERLRSDAQAVVLDAASLAALALSGQSLAVSASVLMRLVAERLSDRLMRQADELLAQLLPAEAEQYQVLRTNGDANGDVNTVWSWWPLRSLRAGDCVRLFPGDVVPADGCVVDGSAALLPPTRQATPREVGLGDHVAAGECLHEGTLELRAEAAPAGSRLERLRAHVRHALGTREPAGPLAPDVERFLSMPLTAAALVFGFTGDTARAASMLQADPQQGLDLAVPLAREAALGAMARQGMLASGLEAIDRLATAKTLALQDTGVLASGRWRIEAVEVEPGGDAQRVREWITALADAPPGLLEHANFSDRQVREWVRHGAVLQVEGRELHLASGVRLQRIWGLGVEHMPQHADAEDALRRVLAVVAAGRVVARVTLVSDWREGVQQHLAELRQLGFERIAVFVEGDGSVGEPPAAEPSQDAPHRLPDDAGRRTDWLAEAMGEGLPLVLVHTVLRDLLPTGSLSLTPVDADAGSHGVLLGDPLASLVAARRLAQTVHRRLKLHQSAAVATNAALMTASALSWARPMTTTLAHHGFALLLLLDSMRLESLGAVHAAPDNTRHSRSESP